MAHRFQKIICPILAVFLTIPVFAQNNQNVVGSTSFYNTDGILIQRLTWQTLDAAEYYEITVQRNTINGFVPHSTTKTFSSFYDFTLPPEFLCEVHTNRVSLDRISM